MNTPELNASRPTTRLLPALALLCLVVALAATPAPAGLDIEFDASVRLDDDTDLYLAISSRYFERDRRTLRRATRRYRDPDDLAVAFYIGKHSGRSADEIYSLRRDGRSWWEISLRFGLPADIWFVETRRAPGPPYGKAYGHWKKHKRGRRATVTLSDADLRNLVAVRMLHEYYDVSVELAMEWRASGDDLRSLMSAVYHDRHRATTASPSTRDDGQGNGRGKKNKPKR